MSEAIKLTRLDVQMSMLEAQYDEAMFSGNYEKAATIALSFFAAYKGLEACERSQQKDRLVEQLKDANEKIVKTYKRVDILGAHLLASGVQIAGGLLGVGGIATGALASGTVAAVGKGLAGTATSVGQAGSGIESGTNAVSDFVVNGKRHGLNAEKDAYSTERSEIAEKERSAKDSKTKAFEQNNERRRAKENAMRTAAGG